MMVYVTRELRKSEFWPVVVPICPPEGERG